MASAPRAPRGLVALIAAITVLPLALLTWFGLRLIEQDRALEAQQTRQRVERAADLAVAAIDREVRIWEQRLATMEARWREPAVAVTFSQNDVIRAAPALAYWPVAVSQPEAVAAIFAKGESLEFQARDFAGAASTYRGLAESADPVVRAGAIARLGRVLHSLGRKQEARELLARLQGDDVVNVHGVPASLVATYAIGRSLESTGDRERLARVASELSQGLDSGRWRILPDVYALYRRDAIRWGAAEPPSPHWPEVLADAVSVVWTRWRSGDLIERQPLQTREVLRVQDQRLTLVWTVADRFHGLLVSPDFVEAHWRTAAAAVEREHAVSVRIAESAGGAVAPVVDDGRTRARRLHQVTTLPWTLEVTSTDPPAERAEFASRRRWILSGLVLFGVLAAAASYLIYRAVSREMALARQQADFVSAVSHEFRTPLTSMRQFTEMLIDQPDLSPDRRRQAHAAQQRATDRLSRLVESLLEFGRLQAGAARVHLASGALDRFLHDVVEDFTSESVAGSHPVMLETEPIVAEFDEAALATAVRNLLENAVKYSPETQPIEVGLRRQNGCAHISVRDHGIGIPERERGHVFGRFTRGERARTLGIKGTGIGLAMVAEIVREHRGEVRVESIEGEGSTFTISIPARS